MFFSQVIKWNYELSKKKLKKKIKRFTHTQHTSKKLYTIIVIDQNTLKDRQ